jgi:excisionase family DNA binding protein
MDDDVLDVRSAAALLGVGRNTLYEAAARGQVPHRRVGRLLRFSRQALLSWLAGADPERMAPWSEQGRSQDKKPCP